MPRLSNTLLLWIMVFMVLLLADLCICMPISIKDLVQGSYAPEVLQADQSENQQRRIRQLEKLLAQMVKSKHQFDGFFPRPGK